VRILFWSDTFWPVIGGVQVLGGNLARALRTRGHELVIVARRDTPDLVDRERYFGIPVERFPFAHALRVALDSRDLRPLMALRRRLADLVRSFDPELVHIYQPGPGIHFYRQVVRAQPTPVLATLHQGYASPLLDPEWLHGRILRAATWITACSSSILGLMRQRLPEITGRSSVILNSLEMPPVAPAPLSRTPPRILCLGRLVREKGFDLALLAWAHLARRFPGGKLLVGGDGPARPDLLRLVTDLGLDSVEFLGWVAPDNVPMLINASTLVLMPSRTEPFGLVALQSAQMARPVVATRVGGLPEVIVEGKTGFLTEPEDVGGLARAIQFLLEHPSAAAAMGRAARRRAEEVFDWNAHVDAYEVLYRRLATSPDPRVNGATG
jgi:glycogen(starch) synthase